MIAIKCSKITTKSSCVTFSSRSFLYYYYTIEVISYTCKILGLYPKIVSRKKHKEYNRSDEGFHRLSTIYLLDQYSWIVYTMFSITACSQGSSGIREVPLATYFAIASDWLRLRSPSLYKAKPSCGRAANKSIFTH